MRKHILLFLFICLLFPETVFAFPPMPAKVGGTVMVDGTLLNRAADPGYLFKIIQPDGSDFMDASANPAHDTDGLDASGYYIIDIPIYHETNQPAGARPGETAVIQVFLDGTSLPVVSPENGEITVGESGSLQMIPVEIEAVPDNQPPSANAGPDQTVFEGARVSLNASASFDPDDGDGIGSFSWQQTTGPIVNLSDGTAAKPEFTAPDTGSGDTELIFELTVSDTAGLLDTDTTVITVVQHDDTPPVVPETTIVVLTDMHPDAEVKTGSARIYGSAGTNRVTLEKGAAARLLHFPGSNEIRMPSVSSGFLVSRSGVFVTFEGPEGTVLTIPATPLVQTISFTDRDLILMVYQNQVMLDDQVITQDKAFVR
jgi:hypothetical protein